MRQSIDPKVFFALTEDPSAALRFVAQFGALAPSVYNTQPWKFHLRENAIEIWGDERRALPAADGSRRQFFISIGCAVENILIAADWYGLPAQVNYFLDPAKPMFVARIHFDRMISNQQRVSQSHLGAFLAARHNDRSPFDPMPVPEEFLASARALTEPGMRIDFVTDERARAAAVKIAANAVEEALRDQRIAAEFARWIRPNLATHQDGISRSDLALPFFASLAIRFGGVAAQQRTRTERLFSAAPVICVVSTVNDEPRDFVNTGQCVERMWLTAEQANLRVGMLAAPVQFGRHYRELQDLLHITERPQAFFRLGYANAPARQSSRRSIDEIIAE